MEIIVAKTAGFCFGVDRALKKVYDSLGEKRLYAYGEVIHNHQVTQALEERGVITVMTLDELVKYPQGSVIIRSHGTSKKDLDFIREKGFTIIDATCPYVKKIHHLVKQNSVDADRLLIIGDENHPEVQGIIGWSSRPYYVIKKIADIDKLDKDYSYYIVTQTTFNTVEYDMLIDKLQKDGFRVIINDTICLATEERQKEALELAKKVDVMLVVGGKHSSNTQKLYQICKAQCEKTYHIETIEEIELNVLDCNAIIGITAGASTPKNIIEEVISNVRNAKREKL